MSNSGETFSISSIQGTTLTTPRVTFTSSSAPTPTALSVYTGTNPTFVTTSATRSATFDISGITAPRVLILPDASDALTLTTHATTLTNKVISQTNNTLTSSQIGPVVLSGVPSAGQALIATSSSTAAWTTITSGSLYSLATSSTYTSAAFTPLTTNNGKVFYPGSATITLQQAYFVLYASDLTTTATVRIFDTINNHVICSVTTTTDTAAATQATNIANLSVGVAQWDIQVSRGSGAGTVTFAGVTLLFG